MLYNEEATVRVLTVPELRLVKDTIHGLAVWNLPGLVLT